MKRINACRKGKVAERDAAKFLRSLGFADARRTQQHTGDAGDSDVVCPDSLPDVFIEVKSDRRARLGGAFLWKAYLKAVEQSEKSKQYPVVLWRQPGSGWRLYTIYKGAAGTFTGTAWTRMVLTWAQAMRQESPMTPEEKAQGWATRSPKITLDTPA